MRAFKPVLYTNNHSHKADVWICNTYREAKKKIPEALKQSITGQIEIYRSKRGQWGEWFEHWKLVNGKPKIIKEGWQ